MLSAPDTSSPAAHTAFDGKYLSITTFRADGTGVATPVWFVEEDGRLLVETDACSGKVRRLRRTPDAEIALCSARGKLHGAPVHAHVELLPESENARVEALIARKYRVDLWFIRPIRWFQMHLGKDKGGHRPLVLAVALG